MVAVDVLLGKGVTKVTKVGGAVARGVTANADDLVTIGRQADVAVAKNWPGHQVLDLPAERWSLRLKDAWIKSAIEKRARLPRISSDQDEPLESSAG